MVEGKKKSLTKRVYIRIRFKIKSFVNDCD